MTRHDEHGVDAAPAAQRRRLAFPHGRLALHAILVITLVAMLILHWDQLFSGNALAIALVAACLLLHPLMHRGHGGHGGGGGRQDDPR